MSTLGSLLCAVGSHRIRGVPGWRVCTRPGCGYRPNPRQSDPVRIVEADPGASPAGSTMTNKMLSRDSEADRHGWLEDDSWDTEEKWRK